MLKWVLNLLTGSSAAQQISGGVVNTVGALAVLGPAAVWFIAHKDEPFVSLSYGEAAVIGMIVFVVLKAAHWTPPPRPPGQ